MKSLLLLTVALATSLTVMAAPKKKVNLQNDFETLGDNAAIVEKAKALDPENKVQIVQNRAVDRHNRVELAFQYGLVTGGDAYLKTQNIGGGLEYHLTPRWSFGLRYYQAANDLTTEGKNVYEEARLKEASGDKSWSVNKIDYPYETGLITASFYPIYGKLNIFNMAVTQFDIYTMLGYGKTRLRSGQTDTYAAGGGVGFWMFQYAAMRLEARYQMYQDQHMMDKLSRIDTVVFTASIGLLL